MKMGDDKESEVSYRADIISAFLVYDIWPLPIIQQRPLAHHHTPSLNFLLVRCITIVI